MIRPKWLIEDFMGDNSTHPLVDEVTKQGFECKVIKYKPFGLTAIDFYPKNGCVIFQGSICFAKHIQSQKLGWYPGVICDWDKYKCSSYYTSYGKYLLNSDYVMMPLAEVYRRKDKLLENYGEFHIRPDTGDKVFPGAVLNKNSFHNNTWKFIESQAKLDQLVVISSRKNIEREWRIFCRGNEIITGSLYQERFKTKIIPGIPDNVTDYAEEIVNNTVHPDKMYCLDICETSDGKLALLEIGAFSVAGLYGSDLSELVRVASEVAVESFAENAYVKCDRCQKFVNLTVCYTDTLGENKYHDGDYCENCLSEMNI